MIVTVRLFAAARAMANDNQIQLDMADSATVADVRHALLERIPSLRPLERSLRFAVNEEYVSEATPIGPGDELACIPPVSGG